MVPGRGDEKLAPPVGSAALCARVAELVDAGELDSPGSHGSCRFESCLGYASFVEGNVSVFDPS
jgi:hypothetical protein